MRATPLLVLWNMEEEQRIQAVKQRRMFRGETQELTLAVEQKSHRTRQAALVVSLLCVCSSLWGGRWDTKVWGMF